MRAACLIALLATVSGCSHLAQADLIELQRQADSAYANADFARASEHYQRLAHALPTDAGVRYQLANSQAHLGSHSAAIENYRAALMRDPQHARAWHNLLQVQLREAQLSAQEMQHYLNPQTPHAQRALARAAQVLNLESAP